MQLLNFIVCDDIRNEVDDKVSLMGVYVYADDLRVRIADPNAPFLMRLAVFISIKLSPDELQPDSCSLEIRFGDGTVVTKADSPISVRDKDVMTLIVAAVMNQLTLRLGDLVFEISFRAGNSPVGSIFKHVVKLVQRT